MNRDEFSQVGLGRMETETGIEFEKEQQVEYAWKSYLIIVPPNSKPMLFDEILASLQTSHTVSHSGRCGK